MAIQAYLSKQEKCQIDNLNLHIKEVEKEEQSPKLAETNTPLESNYTPIKMFKKKTKRKKRERTQINFYSLSSIKRGPCLF